MDTIFALSSGAPPAAIAVVRISGPAAGEAVSQLAGALPRSRRASLRTLRDAQGAVLDTALVLWFPGPATATGEDLAELHLHGGRAVVAAVEAALEQWPKLRRATAGEFTRRAFINGRIDLAEAEGLADLLSAETEMQRASALAMAGGQFSRQIEDWRKRTLAIAAEVEALLDFGDEDDVDAQADFDREGLAALIAEITVWIERPRAETLHDGYRVVLAGPPNAGKSTLFNALIEAEAAITSPLAGTTRDVLTRTVSLEGVPVQFSDTAGLREFGSDTIEAMGMERARCELERADLLLWLGPPGNAPSEAWVIAAQVDRPEIRQQCSSEARHRVSARTGEGLDALRHDILGTARVGMPRPGDTAINSRHRRLLREAATAGRDAGECRDLLVVAEHLREMRLAFDALTGHASTEAMLDTLFSRFCIGK